jgi:predicted nucleic acid-binding protein
MFDTRDNPHEPAIEALRHVGDSPIITTSAVLTEVLAYFSGATGDLRKMVATGIRSITAGTDYRYLFVDPEVYNDALTMYCDFDDKQWSHTDCIS